MSLLQDVLFRSPDLSVTADQEVNLARDDKFLHLGVRAQPTAVSAASTFPLRVPSCAKYRSTPSQTGRRFLFLRMGCHCSVMTPFHAGTKSFSETGLDYSRSPVRKSLSLKDEGRFRSGRGIPQDIISDSRTLLQRGYVFQNLDREFSVQYLDSKKVSSIDLQARSNALARTSPESNLSTDQLIDILLRLLQSLRSANPGPFPVPQIAMPESASSSVLK
jgi:hypothetical protein